MGSVGRVPEQEEEHVLVELDGSVSDCLSESGATYAIRDLDTETPVLIVTTATKEVKIRGCWSLAGSAGGIVLVDPLEREENAFCVARRALRFRT